MFSSQNLDHPTDSFVYGKASIRSEFVSKVFSIVALQLISTAAINLMCHAFPLLSRLAIDLRLLWILTTLGITITFVCFRDIARKVPQNYYLLLLFTIAESFSIYSLTMGISKDLILTSLFYTALTVGLLAIFATTTDLDFTSSRFILYFVWTHLFISLFGYWIFGGSVIMSYIGSLIFALYLIIDLQLIIGQKDKMIEIDEYIHASLLLYTDVVFLFIKILDLANKQEQEKHSHRKQKTRHSL
jgi:FtsH-binding integral membrane protein